MQQGLLYFLNLEKVRGGREDKRRKCMLRFSVFVARAEAQQCAAGICSDSCSQLTAWSYVEGS